MISTMRNKLDDFKTSSSHSPNNLKASEYNFNMSYDNLDSPNENDQVIHIL